MPPGGRSVRKSSAGRILLSTTPIWFRWAAWTDRLYVHRDLFCAGRTSGGLRRSDHWAADCLLHPSGVATAGLTDLHVCGRLFPECGHRAEISSILAGEEESRRELRWMWPTRISVDHVSFSYGKTPVLQGCQLRFPEEGGHCHRWNQRRRKSTLFKLLERMYEPSEGRCRGDRRYPSSDSPRGERVLPLWPRSIRCSPVPSGTISFTVWSGK